MPLIDSFILQAKTETLEILSVKNLQGRMPLVETSHSREPSALSSIVGVGVGEDVVRVYVTENATNVELNSITMRLSQHQHKFETKFIRTPGFVILSLPDNPILCGQSVGHVSVTAGTMGCLVRREGERFILSNNHVLANINAATIGDLVVHPGPQDGRISPRDDIAKLSDFREISFSPTVENEMDVAIAKILDGKRVSAKIQTVGYPSNVVSTASVGQKVKKHGRTTGYTEGIVVDNTYDGFVSFNGQQAWFVNQIVIEPTLLCTSFSEGGDSGSLIVDLETNNPTALLFAGDSTMTLGNPFGIVKDEFKFDVIDHD